MIDGHFKVFLDSKGHLGEVQHQRHQGLEQEQGYRRYYILCEFIGIGLMKCEITKLLIQLHRKYFGYHFHIKSSQKLLQRTRG